MKRRTLDLIFAVGGLAIAGLILVLGLVLQNQADFAKDYVHNQLAAQKITFTPAQFLSAEENNACLTKNAAKPLVTGHQAECYANQYIALHLKAINDGKTYAETSSAARPGREGPSTAGPDDSRGEGARGSGRGDARQGNHPVPGGDPAGSPPHQLRLQHLRRTRSAGRLCRASRSRSCFLGLDRRVHSRGHEEGRPRGSANRRSSEQPRSDRSRGSGSSGRAIRRRQVGSPDADRDFGGDGARGRGVWRRGSRASGTRCCSVRGPSTRRAAAVDELEKEWGDRVAGRLIACDNAWACDAPVVILAVHAESAIPTVQEHADRLAGKIVVSMANNLVKHGNEFNAVLPPHGSVAAEIQALLWRSRVCTAFHSSPRPSSARSITRCRVTSSCSATTTRRRAR